MADAKAEISKVEKEVKTEVESIESRIDAWFVKHFHNNKISQDESSYAIAHAAKEDLKAILAQL